MIVDTSAWVEYLRATGSAADLLINTTLLTGGILLVPAVVLQEVLQGARSPAHYLSLQRELDQLAVFEPEDVLDLHRQAALLYARCRWQGLTVRSPMDCIVAACALEADMPLLARDQDFAALARIEPKLKLIF
jgi:predicted nucleic acid-binding protein